MKKRQYLPRLSHSSPSLSLQGGSWALLDLTSLSTLDMRPSRPVKAGRLINWPIDYYRNLIRHAWVQMTPNSAEILRRDGKVKPVLQYGTHPAQGESGSTFAHTHARSCKQRISSFRHASAAQPACINSQKTCCRWSYSSNASPKFMGNEKLPVIL